MSAEPRVGAQRIAVIGAGPAGLTAAHRLRMAGHHPTVLESAAVAGGRTHTQHHGPGHWTDDGAGWLGTFYPDTLALLEELGLRDRLRVLPLRGGGDLLVEGRLHPNPNSVRRILTSGLLSATDKARLLAWMGRLFLTQPGQLRMDDRLDGTTAAATLAGAGAAATAWVVRPSFEGPFFARLDELSGALVRSWMRALSVGTFFQVDGGMDSPWRDLAARLDVRLGTPVERVTPITGGVEVRVGGQAERYDGAVVAVPAPVATHIVASEALPQAVADIEYAPHVRVYLARRGPAIPRSGVHAFPNETVATVELGAGGDGSWGRVPEGWQWALLCAPAASSGRLLGLSDEALAAELWAAGSAIDARLFPLATAEIMHVVRWQHAVPTVGVGYLARVRSLPRRPPIVFAGDWLVQPCVEGAVRSGIAAAAAFGGPGVDATGGAR